MKKHAQRRPETQPASPKRLSSSTTLPLWKKLLFSAVLCLATLLVAEGVLALFGIRPVSFEADPYVGFTSKSPLFVKDAEARDPQALVTAPNKRRTFNVQRFSATKPKGTYRIFCLGGSTMYGHPYKDSTSFCGWLRAMLPQADGSRNWEVINCGGISYASYREALLMEELIAYQPDLFIVLSGHNEFLEQRTYNRIIAMPETLRGVSAVLGRTRVYTAMKQLYGKVTSPAPAPPALTNLLSANVDTILEHTVGPESYHRDLAWRKQVVDHFRFNLSRMIDIAGSAGAQVMLITPACNLRSCAPFKSEHRPDWNAAFNATWDTIAEDLDPLWRNKQWRNAVPVLDRMRQLDDSYAMLHYMRGQALWELGRFQEAKVAFGRARDEDVCPLRSPQEVLTAVHETAVRRAAPELDFVKLIEAKSLNGVPGDDWFLDHVHPTIEGHRILALAALDELEQRGILHRSAAWNETVQMEIRRRVESSITAEEQAGALCTLAKVLAWAGKDREAYDLALRAVPLAPGDAAIQFEAGKEALKVGDGRQAIPFLRQAVAIKTDFVEAHSLLGNALSTAGQYAEAAEECRAALRLRPDDARLYLNLAMVLLRQQQTNDAVAQVRQAIQLAPELAESHNTLGWMLKDLGQLTEALAEFRSAVRLRPGAPASTIGLAWLLATHPDARQRNVEEATRLGESLVQLSNHENWMSLDTLAAAYAAAGRFPEAVTAATQALELVQRKSPPDAPSVAARLALYRQGLPYRETDRSP